MKIVTVNYNNLIKDKFCSANNWWTRSGFWNSSNSNANFVNVNTSGTQNNNNANNTNGLALGFCNIFVTKVILYEISALSTKGEFIHHIIII